MSGYSYYDNYYGDSYGCGASGCAGGIGFLVFLIALTSLAIIICIASLIAKKADKEGHSFISWFILGLFFNIYALLALYVGLSAEKKNRSFSLWALLGFILSVTALLMLEAGAVAERKGYDFDCYCVMAIFFGVWPLLIACFLPDKKVVKVICKENEVVEDKKESILLKSYNASQTAVKSTKVSPKIEKWTCEKCGELNVSTAANCINCFAEKPKN